MNKQIIATGCLLSSLLFPLKANAASFFSDIYVFGDSLSDTGRAFAATRGLVPAYPDGDGRFSNGAIWVEYLAERLNLPYNPANNFAVGGATTGSANIGTPLISFPTPDLIGLQQQLAAFTTANPTADADALYLIGAGANDYLGGGSQDPTIPVTNLTKAVASLAAIGAENILVINLPSLGTLPLASGEPTVAATLNLLSSFHNSGLATSLDNLNNLLAPPVEVTLFDLNSLLNQALSPNNSFGFTNTTDSCLNLSTGIRCDNPDEYIFWDDLHVTTAAHKVIGDEVFATLVPEPNATSSLIVIGSLGTVLLLAKKRSSRVGSSGAMQEVEYK